MASLRPRDGGGDDVIESSEVDDDNDGALDDTIALVPDVIGAVPTAVLLVAAVVLVVAEFVARAAAMIAAALAAAAPGAVLVIDNPDGDDNDDGNADRLRR